MGAFYPIIHCGFRCRRPDLDAHQMPPCRLAQSLEEVLYVGINARKHSAEWRTCVANTMRDSKGKYPTCGFRNQVGTAVHWNWSHVPLWVISGHADKSAPYPLCPRERTCSASKSMSALCQKQT